MNADSRFQTTIRQPTQTTSGLASDGFAYPRSVTGPELPVQSGGYSSLSSTSSATPTAEHTPVQSSRGRLSLVQPQAASSKRGLSPVVFQPVVHSLEERVNIQVQAAIGDCLCCLAHVDMGGEDGCEHSRDGWWRCGCDLAAAEEEAGAKRLPRWVHAVCQLSCGAGQCSRGDSVPMSKQRLQSTECLNLRSAMRTTLHILMTQTETNAAHTDDNDGDS